MSKKNETKRQAVPHENESEGAQAQQSPADAAQPESAPLSIEADQPAAAQASADEAAQLRAKLAEQKDLLMRTAAEFDNYKKRTQREREALSLFLKTQVVRSFLPVLDSLDRAAQAAPDSEEYQKGMAMIAKQLEEALKGLGLTEIEALGKPFDPSEHEAVMHVEDDAAAENTVVSVLQKGYKLADAVVRPAMVQVAN